MYYCMYVVKGAYTVFNNILKGTKPEKIKTEKDLEDIKLKLYESIMNLKLGLNEYKNLTGSKYYDNLLKAADKFTQTIKPIEDITQLLSLLDMFVDYNFNDIDFDQIDRYSYSKFYIRKNIIEYVLYNEIKSINRNITLFKSQLCEDLFESISNNQKNILCYGLEYEEARAERAKKYAERIIRGNLKGCRISNNAFDIIISCPKLFADLKNNMSMSMLYKNERKEFNQMFSYLRSGGIMIFVLPYFRIHKDICKIISSQFEKVQIIKGYDDYEKENGLVYIIGQKKDKKDFNLDIYNKLRRCCNYDSIKELNEIETIKYTLPADNRQIDIFKGSMIDEVELLNIAQKSGCIDNFFEKQKVNKIGDTEIKPLLPFNIGQIGLVLTSGCLDGIIQEDEENCHLVKGRVVKTSDKQREIINGEVHEKIINNNKVEINVLLPDGSYKTLA